MVVETYKNIGVIAEVAKKLNISVDSVSHILHERNIEINDVKTVMTSKYGKITNMYDLKGEFIRSFPSTNEAARFMVENNLTNCQITTIKNHIREVCIGKRKTAAKFKWSYAK